MLANTTDQPDDGDALHPAEETFRNSVLDRIARIEEKIDKLLKDRER